MKTGRVHTQGGVEFKDGSIQLSAYSLDNIPYNNPAYPELNTVRDALDHILFFPLEVNLTGGGNYTKGRAVNGDSITLNWSVNKDPVYQSLNQGIGILNNTVRSYTLTGLTFTSNTTYQITVRNIKPDGSVEEDKNNTTIRFLDLRFWGTHPNPDITALEVLTLNNELSTNRRQTRTIDGNGEYIYFAYPTYMGEASFVIGGFNTILDQTIKPITNEYGHTENYYIYKTPNIQNGSNISIRVN